MPPDHGARLGWGTVRHARRRPAVHRFAYPAFFLRLPLRRLQRGHWPWRWLQRNRRSVLALHDADHGDGGPLLAWVDRLLRQAGINDADGEIWLHTMPRVFGYVFNPVSFWFAERADGALRAIVCEVNNTFGERHCYVLAHADGAALRWGEVLHARKSMHVSPFNPVRGGYRFRFLLRPQRGEAPARFVARIDYHDEPGRDPVLQTSVGGVLAPLTDAALRRIALLHPLHTLGVILRIHWQAVRLWRKRVPFFRKPAAPAAPLTRAHSDDEPRMQEAIR